MIARRVTIAGAALLGMVLLVTACRKPRNDVTQVPTPPRITTATPPAPAPSTFAEPPTGELREVTFDYAGTPVGSSSVVVAIPTNATKESPLPVLVTFHGRGESMKGPARGARGWIDDYGLKKATKRLASPPLTAADLGDSVAPERLVKLNDALRAEPYRGLIVVCPFLPDIFHGDQAIADGTRYATFIVDEVLPRVYRETPAVGTPETTLVDGVSLGGRAALLVGLLRPKAFRVVAALQPALDNVEARPFAGLAERAKAENPALVVRLLSSSEDYFLEPTVELSRELKSRNVNHTLDIVVGTHSYEFNRGPGVYEMLIFHDRAVRGLESLRH
jgi:enterochelin esterase-like enzyme